MKDYARQSLNGVWVGDCIGNLGQLYYVHDILKALESGMVKFGGQLDKFDKQFVYSDDTEEAIVLYNHLKNSGTRNFPIIDQDKLAMEFATRYMDRDPDGEIYGYGLNTRKVLRDIYEGVSWKDANKIIKKSEGMPSHIDSLVDSLSKGKGFKDAMSGVTTALQKQKQEQIGKEKVGSCGNGSAMRVAPLGAYLASFDGMTPARLIVEAALQAQVTHCHPEGIAGSIAITSLAYTVTKMEQDSSYLLSIYEKWKGCSTPEVLFNETLANIPEGQVRDGILRAKELPLETPIGKAIEILGNGTHVTCQDTVPLCCWLTIKALTQYQVPEMYEKSIIETSMAFGDVDTNCAIVGGIIGIVSSPPEKWSKFCNPMEGVDEQDYKLRFRLSEMTT